MSPQNMSLWHKTDSDQRERGGGKWGKESVGSSQGTCINDPWTWTTLRRRLKMDGRGWIGLGTVMGGNRNNCN